MSKNFVIGDIHGCAKQLRILLASISPTKEDTIVFLGDYIDRGPDSKEVIDIIIDLKTKFNVVTLKGNHEDMFLDWLRLGGNQGGWFIHNGGDTTLESYGLVSACHIRDEFDAMDVVSKGHGWSWDTEYKLKVGWADKLFPLEHLEFLKQLKIKHETDKYIFVHAGFNLYREIDKQLDEDLLWVREEWLGRMHSIGKTVIHGHTPVKDVSFNTDSSGFIYAINLDTGCVFDKPNSKLSCLVIDSSDNFSTVQVDKKTNKVIEKSY